MQRLIFGGEEFHRLYNCSFYNVSDIPLEQRRNIPLGIAEIVIGTIQLLLYIPCMVSIWLNREISCYKILFVMGVMDIVNLVVLGPISGYFTLAGIVYCSCPTFIYIVASIATGFTIGEKMVELLVAINRLLYFTSERLARKIFRERSDRTWLYTILPILYTLLFIMVGQPAIFSSILHHWIWNPHWGYASEMTEYFNNPYRFLWFAINECFIMIALPTVYIIFICFVKKQRQMIDSDDDQFINTTAAFVQVSLISFINFAYCFIFTINNFTVFGFNNIFEAVQLWLCMQIHGLPPIIYLCLNETIQMDCLRMLEMLINKLS